MLLHVQHQACATAAAHDPQLRRSGHGKFLDDSLEVFHQSAQFVKVDMHMAAAENKLEFSAALVGSNVFFPRKHRRCLNKYGLVPVVWTHISGQPCREEVVDMDVQKPDEINWRMQLEQHQQHPMLSKRWTLMPRMSRQGEEATKEREGLNLAMSRMRVTVRQRSSNDAVT